MIIYSLVEIRPLGQNSTRLNITSQISKNRQKSAFRFLAIFGDLCPIFGDFWRFLAIFCPILWRVLPKNRKSFFFLINRRADTKIGIWRFLYRYSGLQIGIWRYKNGPCRFMTDFNKMQVDFNKIQEWAMPIYDRF